MLPLSSVDIKSLGAPRFRFVAFRQARYTDALARALLPCALHACVVTYSAALWLRVQAEGDHKERAQAMADMVRVSLDDIYLTVGKMEGAYKSVHKRARKLLHEVERANLGASRGQGALQRSSADHLDAGGLASGDSYDLRALISAQARSQCLRRVWRACPTLGAGVGGLIA